MNSEDIKLVTELIEKKDSDQLKEVIKDLHPADIAELCNELDAEDARFIYLLLDNETAADVLIEMDEDALCPEKCKKSVENLFLRILRLGKILGQNPGVSVVPDAADQIDRGVVAGKAGCLDIEKEQIGDSS